jgi:hypothetical protein
MLAPKNLARAPEPLTRPAGDPLAAGSSLTTQGSGSGMMQRVDGESAVGVPGAYPSFFSIAIAHWLCNVVISRGSW